MLAISHYFLYIISMENQDIQIIDKIVIPWDKLDNLTQMNAQLLIYLASGMKPAQATEFWNTQNPDNMTTADHCSKTKNRYKEEYQLMRADVLKHVHLQTLGGALVMARDRLTEMLLKYEGNGKQGSLTECLNALQGISKLYKDADEELQQVSPDKRTESAQAILNRLRAGKDEE